MPKPSRKTENEEPNAPNKRSAKNTGIVEHTASDERAVTVEKTGDVALDAVLTEAGAGATNTEMDVEAPEATEVYAAEIEAESEKVGAQAHVEVPLEPVPDLGEPADEKPETPVHKHHNQASKKDPHGKKYRAAIKDLDLKSLYSKEEAIELAKKTSYTSFDGSVEVHIKLSVQNQRGVITLPSGTGRERTIAAATSENIDDMVKAIEAGKLDFDILLATPDVMAKLAKVARILGPKGLMPNPKSGTVTADIDGAKKEFNSGRIEYKQDKGGVIHRAIGKVSFDSAKLVLNLDTLLAALPAPKIESITLSATMGPGIKVAL